MSLYEIKEVRAGKNSKDFKAWAAEIKKVDGDCCFVLFYGVEFRLKTLSVSGNCWILWIFNIIGYDANWILA